MGRIRTVIATVGAALSLGTPALAQRPPQSSTPRMPMWDAGASVGFHWAPQTELGGTDDAYWEIQGEYRIEVGRYWTSHLKTELSFSQASEWDDFESEIVPVAGLRDGGYAFTDRKARLHAFSPAVSWQFLENSLMHPYVTGGARINVLREHRFREQTTYRSGSISYTVPPVDERRTTTTVRPFVAVGCKSYLTSRTFVRSEMLAAFGPGGGSNAALRLGFGVDF